MKKNVMLVLWLASIVLLAGCGWQKASDVDNVNIAQAHPEWVKTSLTVEDLEHIEETLPPLSYTYETWDSEAQAIVNSGSYEVAEGEKPVFMIPEYATMANREVTSSGIEDDMIYTITKLTLQDDTQLDVLYVNEPDTLLCRAISIQNWSKSTLYTDFVYDADIE